MYVCPLNNISFYYSAYMQFCQVLFLNNYICDIIVLDKIGNRVYNVHRNHQGGLYAYTIPIYTFPLGVFQGILSEYLALKYSPKVVYTNLGYFLVTGYIHIRGVGVALVYPWFSLGFCLSLFLFFLGFPWVALGLHLGLIEVV